MTPENFENHTERSGIPVIEDLGSGVLINLEEYGLSKEPTVQEEVKAGADVVCFSGDKLFGGAQAGVLVGKKKYIDQMRNHPLLRALRADKFTLISDRRSVEMLSGSERSGSKDSNIENADKTCGGNKRESNGLC